MPIAPVRLCAGGCGTATVHGQCPVCAKARAQRRETATVRGYDTDWQRFRPRFVADLVEAGIPPVCGAALPTGPQTQDSACKAKGLFTYTSADGSSLHFDHEPPLTDAERNDPAIVCDPNRIQLLCAEDHARKDDPGRGRQA